MAFQGKAYADGISRWEHDDIAPQLALVPARSPLVGAASRSGGAGSHLRGIIGIELISRSVAAAFKRSYEAGFRSWSSLFSKVNGSGRVPYTVDASPEDVSWALIDFAAWCSESHGNLASTISGKFAAFQYFHRVAPKAEEKDYASTDKVWLRVIARFHVERGVQRRTRLPVIWKMLLDGESPIRTWGVGGRVTWLCLCLSYSLIARSDEMFATSHGDVHPAHCITRQDVAFFSGDVRLADARLRQADRIEVWFRGHEGDQHQIGDVRIRTRDVATRARAVTESAAGPSLWWWSCCRVP